MKAANNFIKKFNNNLIYNVSLSNYSWFNLGGNAEYFFKPNNKNQLIDFLHFPEYSHIKSKKDSSGKL